MAETTAQEEQKVVKPKATYATAYMVADSAESAAPSVGSKQKRPREEDEEDLPKDDVVSSKKRKVDKKKKKKMKEKVANEEQEKEATEEQEKGKEAEEIALSPVKLGYKTFDSPVKLFDYFFKLLHSWPLNLDLNKYEHTMLLELLKDGDYDGEFGGGIRAFQVRKHPEWQSRRFFFIREDGSVEDFSFRKYVHRIFPLPVEMRPKAIAAFQLRGKHPGGRGRGGRDGGQAQGGRGS